jgi:peptide/nickel transport system ATP-binding protein
MTIEAPSIPRESVALSTAPPLLEIEALQVDYGREDKPVHAVRGVSLTVRPGEVVAIVGESGSGKSTTAHAVLQLLHGGRISGGTIRFAGEDITRASRRRMVQMRGSAISLIPQDPGVSLNPVLRVGDQVAEVLRIHGKARGRAAEEQAVQILRDVGLHEPELRARQYPHELSGGMRQRVLIGIALACQPQLVIADEATSALDVTVQRRVLDLLAEMTARSGTAVLLITHDLGVAADRADRVVVMQQGQVVEAGPARDILARPQHPYTQALLAAAPGLAVRRATTPAMPKGAMAAKAAPPAPLVTVSGLSKSFRLGPGRELKAVQNVSFSIPRGQTFSIVGESGSGKSTTARMISRLETASSGSVLFDGLDLTKLAGEPLRLLRRRFQLVYQNPYSSLDPRMNIEEILTEPLRAFGLGSRVERRTRAATLLDQVALPAKFLERRPGTLSGGQRQRVAIARALALQPDLLVLDEPVSALDVSVQDQILRLLAQLQAEVGLTYLMISHDLAVVRQISHRVGVMYCGEMVEVGDRDAIFDNPQHEYTQELLAAIPGRMA